MHGAPGAVMGSVFFIVWLLMMGIMIGGWVVVMIALWRGMKAHESIAWTLSEVAQTLKSRQG